MEAFIRFYKTMPLASERSVRRIWIDTIAAELVGMFRDPNDLVRNMPYEIISPLIGLKCHELVGCLQEMTGLTRIHIRLAKTSFLAQTRSEGGYGLADQLEAELSAPTSEQGIPRIFKLTLWSLSFGPGDEVPADHPSRLQPPRLSIFGVPSNHSGGGIVMCWPSQSVNAMRRQVPFVWIESKSLTKRGDPDAPGLRTGTHTATRRPQRWADAPFEDDGLSLRRYEWLLSDDQTA